MYVHDLHDANKRAQENLQTKNKHHVNHCKSKQIIISNEEEFSNDLEVDEKNESEEDVALYSNQATMFYNKIN